MCGIAGIVDFKGRRIERQKVQAMCAALKHRGPDDDRLFHQHGPAAFRQGRIPELCQEALSQGALLTCEDLAYRVFFVSPRTITRDLKVLRQANPDVVIPLRSTVHDIGPVLTHRTQIVRLALQGGELPARLRFILPAMEHHRPHQMVIEPDRCMAVIESALVFQ